MRFYKVAPQVGLEPTTLRLRMFLCFHIGADYLINFPEEVAGRLRGLIGLAPQPLVSARSCLPCAESTGLFSRLRSGLPSQLVAGVGFPEFTQFFNHSHLWKLQRSRMNLSMAIGA